MDLAENIISAEENYRQILEEFFIESWSKTVLSSHDIDHHRRVWHYAKELLETVTDSQKKTFQVKPEKLIMACYLHDIGMSIDPGTKHGKHSRDLTRQFLIKNHINKTEFGDVLHAIENHDDKDYSDRPAANPLLSILSIADDLDAFGRIGIYRYSEIYLTRGVPLKFTGYKIMENSGKRFKNFEDIANNLAVFEKHKQRYQVLNDFFTFFNLESDQYHFGDNEPSGYCGVLEIISGMINMKIPLVKILSDRNGYSRDPVIFDFLDGLSKELDEFKPENKTML